MSWTERNHYHLDLRQDGEGRPDRVYVDIVKFSSTFLAGKGVERLFFGAKKGISWDHAKDLIGEMNKSFDLLCVVHSPDSDES